MQKVNFIDIHAHHKVFDKQTTQVLIYDELPNKIDDYFFYGIHPWTAHKQFDQEAFLSIKNHTRFLGLGEIGLDKKKEHYKKQIQLFEQQVHFAVSHNIKLLTIHMISSLEDILSILKNARYSQRLLFHDFNLGIEAHSQISAKYEFYVSTGKRYLQNTKTQSLIKTLRPNQFFFESDDDPNFKVSSCYEHYCKVTNQHLQSVKETMHQNFTSLVN